MRGIAGFFVGIVGIGVGIVSFIEARRNQKIADKLEQSIDTIASEQVVDIQQAIIDRAVERAVEQKTGAMVGRAVEVAREETLADIRRQIHDAVEAEFDRQKADISGRLAAEAEKIDMEALKRDVTKKAEEAVLKRFYEMGGIPKIYGAFNGVMDRIQSQSVTMRDVAGILNQFTNAYDKKQVLETLLKNGIKPSDCPFDI